jgi:hypothetical protein
MHPNNYYFNQEENDRNIENELQENSYEQEIFHDLILEGEEYTDSFIRARDGWFYPNEDYSDYLYSESEIQSGGMVYDEDY